MGSRAGRRPWLWQWPSLRMMELGKDSGEDLFRMARPLSKSVPARLKAPLHRGSRACADAIRRGSLVSGQRLTFWGTSIVV